MNTDKKPTELIVVSVRVRETLHSVDCMASADLVDAISNKVYEMLETAIERAKKNGRTTVRPHDL